MKFSCVHAVYFSPAGMTRHLCRLLAASLGERFQVPVRETDFTLPGNRKEVTVFSPEELVVFGSPTYAGKLPNKLLPFIQEGFQGNGAAAVSLVTFGNRSFDNSLAELTKCLTEDGFLPVAGGAFAVRHVFSDTLAKDRPDEKDLGELAAFGKAIGDFLEEKLSGSGDALSSGTVPGDVLSPVTVPGDADAPYYVPKGLDGEPKKFLKAVPKTDPALCDGCGTCASLCPMGSISKEDFQTVTGVCIKCHACVRGCPKGAKYFDDEAFLSHKAMLERDYTQRAENLWIVSK